MDAFADKLGRVGAWCGQNKYLSAIKNAFQNFMPATIAGAVAVLWTCVIVNKDSGLGIFFEPIMAIEPFNAVFNAINTATIGCMAIGICMLVAQEIAEANGETGAYPAVLGFMMWVVVTPLSYSVTGLTAYTDAANKAVSIGDVLTKAGVDAAGAGTFAGISTGYTGATGLFTGLIVGILGMEIYCAFRKMDALKIKMPEQVPPGVARAFEVLVPTVLVLVIMSTIGWLSTTLLGLPLNDLISTYVQEPLKAIIGANIFAVMILYVIIMLFWCVGIHGNNMVSAVKESIFTPMIVENMDAFAKGKDAPNTLNITMMQMFAEWGGSGVTLALVIAIFIFGKREDNRAIATLSVVPGFFNINETVTFGIPLVLNPILDIPFILAPVVTILVGYILTVIGFCPKVVVQAPWTCPPILFGFLATGGNIMGAVSQLIVFVIAVVIYVPFLLAYEKYQNKQSAEA
ncbi:MAG: PTS sugar transporter subunit IIC [Coprobacillus sp.]|nr:PTS sugar transporter subunit IIC [Coprobacillus sp.]